MIRVQFTFRNGTTREISARGGMTLMEAAVQHGIAGIDAECGGACACATCHVILDNNWKNVIGGPNAEEDEMLDATARPRTPASRLSCQIKLDERMDGLRVTVP